MQVEFQGRVWDGKIENQIWEMVDVRTSRGP